MGLPGWLRVLISIHALLAESDREPTALRTPHHIFLSTLSLRRATIPLLQLPLRTFHFYPRSPCGERRIPLLQLPLRTFHFYPRSPCGERRMLVESYSDNRHFYPRSPCGERRQVKQTCRVGTSISIHALLAESDKSQNKLKEGIKIFLSTLSLRRATVALSHPVFLVLFLSTLSLRRATWGLLLT